MSDFKLINWNLAWAANDSPRGDSILRNVFDCNVQVACFTETFSSFLTEHGHTICANPDYGYPIKKDRRKVILWSREPWEDVDALGHEDLPGGRFIAGTTQTALGKVRFIGVCIPWSDAHVASGRCDRTIWEDHLIYVTTMKSILASSPKKTLLMGDFNQSLPRSRAPIHVEQALREVLGNRFYVATEGLTDSTGSNCIDHLCYTPELCVDSVSVLPKITGDGLRLSDHFGVLASVRLS
jgi:Endonuclease/Exonuclease/phosphatase family